MQLKTEPFRISRLQLAYLASAEYLRTLWWVIAVVPVFGIICVIFGRGLLQVIGFTAILWPFSIPARGILATGKSAKLFQDGCWAQIDQEFVTFYGATDRVPQLRWQLPLRSIRDVVCRGPLLLIRTRRLGIAPIRLDAFTDEASLNGFRDSIAEAIKARLNENNSV